MDDNICEQIINYINKSENPYYLYNLIKNNQGYLYIWLKNHNGKNVFKTGADMGEMGF